MMKSYRSALLTIDSVSFHDRLPDLLILGFTIALGRLNLYDGGVLHVVSKGVR